MALTNKIRNAIYQRFGFKPAVILLRTDELETAIESNPFPEAEGEPKTLHLFFLGSEPQNPDMKKLADLKQDNEKYALIGKVFYLFESDGIGRSKLAASVEKALGVTVTARNWRSVCKIMEMAKK